MSASAMTRRYGVRIVVIALLLSASATTTALAQELIPDITELQAGIKRNDTLLVTSATGRVFRWRLADVAVAELLRQEGLAARDIREVVVERRDSPWKGALIGLALAGTPWLIVCAANDWCYYNEYGAENLLRTTALTTAAIGAGVGALIDVSTPARLRLFPRRSPSQ
jgi:hypothetical protein